MKANRTNKIIPTRKKIVSQPPRRKPGLEQDRVPDPSILVIFGASGDLTHRKLLPALYSLAHDGLLPAGQAIVGFARQEYTDDAFRAEIRQACDKYARRRPTEDAIWESFAKGLFYVQGDFSDESAFDRLDKRLKEIDARLAGDPRVMQFALRFVF